MWQLFGKALLIGAMVGGALAFVATCLFALIAPDAVDGKALVLDGQGITWYQTDTVAGTPARRAANEMLGREHRLVLANGQLPFMLFFCVFGAAAGLFFFGVEYPEARRQASRPKSFFQLNPASRWEVA